MRVGREAERTIGCIIGNEKYEGVRLMKRQILAIIDVDCVVRNGFDEEDQKGLENLAALLAESCDW